MQAVARAKDKIKKFRRKAHSGQTSLLDDYEKQMTKTEEHDLDKENIYSTVTVPVPVPYHFGTLYCCCHLDNI